MKTIKEYLTKYPNVSIRKLAIAAGINYYLLLKKSKEPIEGQPYDPEAINYEAIQKKFEAKQIDFTQLDWEGLNEVTGKKVGTLVKDMTKFEVGMKVYLRKDNEVPYQIVYKTETHIVIMKEGTSEPQSWSNNTFLLNGPVFEPRTNVTKAEVETKEETQPAEKKSKKEKKEKAAE